MGVQQVHGLVVGNDQAVEAPALAQDLGDEAPGAAVGLAVYVVIGGHDRAGVRQLHGHLEGQQKHVVQLPLPDAHRSVVAPPFAEGMTGVVLERGQHPPAIPLQAAHVFDGQAAGQVGIFPEGLLRATPAHVPADVQDRRQPLPGADAVQLFADGRGHPAYQLFVPERPEIDGRRKQGGSPGHQPGKAFLVRQRRDLQAGLFYEVSLDTIEPPDAPHCVHGAGAEGARYLADAVAQDRARIGPALLDEPVLCPPKGEAAVLLDVQPYRVQLRHLLLDGHSSQQLSRPFTVIDHVQNN